MSNGKISKIDLAFLATVFFFGLLAILSKIGQRTEFGDIYTILFAVIFIWIGLSLIKKIEDVFEFEFINGEFFWVKVAVGWAYSLMFVGGAYVGVKAVEKLAMFGFLTPLGMPQFSTQAVFGFIPVLAQVFAVSIAVPLLEEVFRSGLLRPTVSEMVGRAYIAPTLLFIAGILIVSYIAPIQLVGIMLCFYAVIQTIFALAGKYSSIRVENIFIRYGLAMSISAPFFALLHLTAYNSSAPLLFSAFLFALLADSVNTFLPALLAFFTGKKWDGKGDITSSLVAHTHNNAVVACLALSVGIEWAVMLTLAMVGILWLNTKADEL